MKETILISLLLLSHDEFIRYNREEEAIAFRLKHPNWPYLLASGGTAYIPEQLPLTAARFAGGKIFTAGIDRSVRVWDKEQGAMLTEWLDHDATINSMDVSKDGRQLVTVDLKGGIRFWNTEIE